LDHLPGSNFIHGPTQWSNSAIALQVVVPEPGTVGVMLVDEVNDVRVIAESVEVKENVHW